MVNPLQTPDVVPQEAGEGRGLVAHWPWLLVLAVFPLMATTAAYHAPLGMMVILGSAYAVRERARLLGDSGVRLILAIFLALWIPQLIALPGAVEPLVSARAAGRYLLYPLGALFILHAMRVSDRFAKLALGVAAVAAIWSVDHFLGPAGIDVLGWYHPELVYPGGIFFDEHTVPAVAATASPLVFELVRRHRRESPWVWLLLALLALLVVISGRRVAWMMFGVAGVAYAGYLFLLAGRPRWRPVTVAAMVMLAGSALAYTQHDLTRERVHITLGLLSADRAVVDVGTSYRLDIWQTSLTMARAHWPVGVGAIGTRHAYADYAAADDFWIRHGFTSPLHPHQFVLEVAVETGLAGLLGYLIALAALAIALARTREPWAWVSGIALGVALFPLNAHVSFYASYWSMMIWWLVGLTAAGLERPRSP